MEIQIDLEEREDHKETEVKKSRRKVPESIIIGRHTGSLIVYSLDTLDLWYKVNYQTNESDEVSSDNRIFSY